MKERLQVLAEYSFLKNFDELLRNADFYEMVLLGKEEDLMNYLNLSKLICNKVDLNLDLNPDEYRKLIESEKGILKKALKSGTSKLLCINKNLDCNTYEFDSGDLNELLLLEQNKKKVGSTMSKYAKVAFNTTTIKDEFRPIQNTGSWFISGGVENDFNGWDDVMSNSYLPISDVIITDNYLLESNSLRDNLIAIIFALYNNKRTSLRMNVSIFLQDPQVFINENSNQNQINIAEKNLDEIEASIDQVWKELNEDDLNICFYLIDKRMNHDRDIITNYFWLHSGHSFTYYNRRGRITKDTTLSYKTVAEENYTISKMVNRYKRILTNVTGDKIYLKDGVKDRNRLLK